MRRRIVAPAEPWCSESNGALRRRTWQVTRRHRRPRREHVRRDKGWGQGYLNLSVRGLGAEGRRIVGEGEGFLSERAGCEEHRVSKRRFGVDEPKGSGQPADDEAADEEGPGGGLGPAAVADHRHYGRDHDHDGRGLAEGRILGGGGGAGILVGRRGVGGGRVGDGADLVAGGVADVEDWGAGVLDGEAELVGALGLVGVGPVEGALLVAAPGADGVDDVVEEVVVGDPAARLVEAGGEEIHAVGGAERQLAAVGADELAALGGVDRLVLHGDAAAADGLVGGRVARVEVVPGIVADVVGAARGVDAQQVQLAVLVGQRDAEVGAVDGAGPVGDAVGVDLAAEDADRRRVAVVGGGPDGAAVAGAAFQQRFAGGRRCGGGLREEGDEDELEEGEEEEEARRGQGASGCGHGHGG